MTSKLTVDHRTTPGNTPVEPDNSDNWIIIATYRFTSVGHSGSECIQTQVTDTAYAKVEWKADGHWDVTFTPGSGLINSVSVCDGSKCTSGGNTHSWEYALLVNLSLDDDPPVGAPRFLYKVEYSTGTLDDGDTINATSCTEVSAVSPYGGASATDFGPFECSFSCATASGPSTTISYQ
jgi:hypothetical protein